MAEPEQQDISKPAYYVIAALASLPIAFVLSSLLFELFGRMGEEGVSDAIFTLFILFPIFYAGSIYSYSVIYKRNIGSKVLTWVTVLSFVGIILCLIFLAVLFS